MTAGAASGFRALLQDLQRAYGPRHWWPAETPFEVMVGAVLTQNTAWQNVERAIDNLKRRGTLAPETLLALPQSELAELIRPSGYFNVKARRLRHLCSFLVDAGGEAALRQWPTEELREALLDVHGIGPETADDILLYAFGRPVFVVDAYTRRLFRRLGRIGGNEGYEQLRRLVEQEIGADAAALNELHALIVHHAKAHCRVRPDCAGCPLLGSCPGACDGQPG